MEIAPIMYKPIHRQNKHIQKMVDEEWKSLGEPRVTTDLLLELQNLAVQKQMIINKYRLNNYEI